MGLRGPQPLPSILKKARGTYREDRASANEPVASGMPTCPLWVKDKDLRKEFLKLAKQLNRMGVVGTVDRNVLTRYCLTWSRWKRVVEALMQNIGAEIMVFKDDNGTVKMLQVSALHSVERSLAEALGRMENAMGMNPASRSRISMMPAKQEEGMGGVLGFIGNRVG
jgi:P27 family predicted phage terminase small subunit